MLPGLEGLDLEALGIPSDKEYMEEYCRCSAVQLKLKFSVA
jgi:hypothetical protein